MIDNVTVEDIAELRKQGSFRDFLRLQFAADQIAPPAPKAEPAPIPETPRGRPGAWPIGTRPPDPTPGVALPPEAWEQAVHDYRAWLAAGQPPSPIHCDCGCTPRRSR